MLLENVLSPLLADTEFEIVGGPHPPPLCAKKSRRSGDSPRMRPMWPVKVEVSLVIHQRVARPNRSPVRPTVKAGMGWGAALCWGDLRRLQGVKCLALDRYWPGNRTESCHAILRKEAQCCATERNASGSHPMLHEGTLPARRFSVPTIRRLQARDGRSLRRRRRRYDRPGFSSPVPAARG